MFAKELVTKSPSTDLESSGAATEPGAPRRQRRAWRPRLLGLLLSLLLAGCYASHAVTAGPDADLAGDGGGDGDGDSDVAPSPPWPDADQPDSCLGETLPGGARVDWAIALGGAGNDRLTDIATSPSGRVFIAGTATAPLSCGGEEPVMGGFLCVFEPTGEPLWSRTVGTEVNVLAFDEARGVICAAGEQYFEDFFIACFDEGGELLWRADFGGSEYEMIRGLAVDGQGQVFATGGFNSSDLDLGGGPLPLVGNQDVFLVKLDAEGRHLWSSSFGASEQDYGMALAVDAEGDVYLTGVTDGPGIDLGGGPLTTPASAEPERQGFYEIFLARFGPEGAHRWSRAFGGEWADTVETLTLAPQGRLWITGSFRSSELDLGSDPIVNGSDENLFVASFSRAGEALTSVAQGGRSFARGQALLGEPTGQVVMAGYYDGDDLDFGGGALPYLGDHDAFVVALDEQARQVWATSLNGPGDELIMSLALGPGGSVLVGGFFDAPFCLGTFGLGFMGGEDLFIAQLRGPSPR